LGTGHSSKEGGFRFLKQRCGLGKGGKSQPHRREGREQPKGRRGGHDGIKRKMSKRAGCENFKSVPGKLGHKVGAVEEGRRSRERGGAKGGKIGGSRTRGGNTRRGGSRKGKETPLA